MVWVVAPVDHRYEEYPAPASNVVDPPGQIPSVPVIVTTGNGFTLTLTGADVNTPQPDPSL